MKAQAIRHVEIRVAGLARGAHQIGAGDGAEFRADEDGGPLLGAGFRVAFDVATLRADEIPGPGRQRGEADPVLLMGLLHPGHPQVLQDHLREGLLLALSRSRVGDALRGVDQLVVLVDAEHPVGRQALDGEWTGDADRLLLGVGLVVEVLGVGLGGDGGVDLLLPGDAGLPPVGVQFGGRLGPGIDRALGQGLDAVAAIEGLIERKQAGFDLARSGVRAPGLLGLQGVEVSLGLGRPGVFGRAGDLPFLPSLFHCGVQTLAQGLQGRLPLVPDDVDLGVVGDGLERDMRHPLVDEAMADAVADRLGRGRGAGDLGLLELTLAGVGEQVIGIAGAHDAGPGQGECDAGGVDGDPAPAPLLGDIGGGAGAAGGVEDEVAGVGGHEDAALKRRRRRSTKFVPRHGWRS